MSPRSFLFLQGHATPFYLRLGQALDRAGHDVGRINICGGDRLFWGDWHAEDFRGPVPDLDAAVSDAARRHGASDLVVYNDIRPCNAIAIAAAKRLGLRVHVFEEGYLRPDWITLERDGVNGNSRLPADPDWYRETARALPPASVAAPVGSGLRERIFYDFRWQAANYRHWLRYPRYRTHRPYPIWAEYATWMTRLSVLHFRRARAKALIADLVERNRRFFLFPLQLDTDSQIRQHSSYGRLSAAIDAVIENFARSAPGSAWLIVKNHPLDNAWINYRRLVERRARTLGVSERVRFIDGGDLNLLLDRCAGVVTVNSTTGLTALQRGRPVIALGKAVFRIPGLTSDAGLDAFWNDPRRPDPGLLSAFQRVLLETCLVNGNFYTEAGMPLAIENSVVRLTAETDLLSEAAPRASAVA
ncbi:capsule biosynthesis protein [Dongia sp.]|uniref:capsule biosynthesis protein n=1 Tax=Dongia sp. TaxID=1977262 RepID=UPI00374FEEA9